MLAGAALFSLSLRAAGQAPMLALVKLCFGRLAGGAMAALFAPMMARVTGWFITQRSLAVSLVSAGIGLAPVTMSPIAARMDESHDWRSVLSILALRLAVVTLPTALLLRRPPAKVPQPGAMAMPCAGMTVRRAVTSPQFLHVGDDQFLLLRHPFGPDFPHCQLWRNLRYFGAGRRVDHSVEGIAGMGGRIGFGLMGDRFCANRVLVAGLLVQAFGALDTFMPGSWESSMPSLPFSASSVPGSCRFIPCRSVETSR